MIAEPVLSTVIRMMVPGDLPRVGALTPERSLRVLPWHLTLVAEREGVVVGYGQYSLDGLGLFYHLGLRIAEAWKGAGIGKALMAARVAIAVDAHCPRHYCLALHEKPIMQKLCERFGMRVEARYPDASLYVGEL